MRYSIAANEPIWMECPHCHGDQRGFPGGLCEECGNTGEVGEDISDLYCLAHNLAVAGALTCAWIGGQVGYAWNDGWTPGCGAPMPGHNLSPARAGE